MFIYDEFVMDKVIEEWIEGLFFWRVFKRKFDSVEKGMEVEVIVVVVLGFFWDLFIEEEIVVNVVSILGGKE